MALAMDSTVSLSWSKAPFTFTLSPTKFITFLGSVMVRILPSPVTKTGAAPALTQRWAHSLASAVGLALPAPQLASEMKPTHSAAKLEKAKAVERKRIFFISLA